jgi:hypothetical protein
MKTIFALTSDGACWSEKSRQKVQVIAKQIGSPITPTKLVDSCQKVQVISARIINMNITLAIAPKIMSMITEYHAKNYHNWS